VTHRRNERVAEEIRGVLAEAIREVREARAARRR